LLARCRPQGRRGSIPRPSASLARVAQLAVGNGSRARTVLVRIQPRAPTTAVGWVNSGESRRQTQRFCPTGVRSSLPLDPTYGSPHQCHGSQAVEALPSKRRRCPFESDPWHYPRASNRRASIRVPFSPGGCNPPDCETGEGRREVRVLGNPPILERGRDGNAPGYKPAYELRAPTARGAPYRQRERNRLDASGMLEAPQQRAHGRVPRARPCRLGFMEFARTSGGYVCDQLAISRLPKRASPSCWRCCRRRQSPSVWSCCLRCQLYVTWSA
jgi:hypothetical protein